MSVKCLCKLPNSFTYGYCYVHLFLFLFNIGHAHFSFMLINLSAHAHWEYLIEDLQVIEDLRKTYGRPTKMGDIYMKSDVILLISMF